MLGRMQKSNVRGGLAVALLVAAGLGATAARADDVPVAAPDPVVVAPAAPPPTIEAPSPVDDVAAALAARDAAAPRAARVPATMPDELKIPDTSPVGLSDVMIPFAKTMFMLLVVVGLIYLTLHKGLGAMVAKAQMGKRMRLVERVTLDQRRALYLIEVDGKEMVLAGAAGVPSTSIADRFTAVLSAKKAPVAGPPVTGVPRATSPDLAATLGETQEG
jgi:flagellar biogenesis protein FliO